MTQHWPEHPHKLCCCTEEGLQLPLVRWALRHPLKKGNTSLSSFLCSPSALEFPLDFSYIFLFSLAFSLIYVSSAGTNLTSGFSRTVCASVSQLVIRNLTLTIYWHYQLLPFLFQTHRLSLMWVFTYWHTFFFFFFWKAFYSNKWKRKST